MGKNILKFKLFESSDNDETLDELVDNISNINDILGQPNISKSKYTESSFIYTFKWNLGFDLSVENDVSKLVDLNKVMSELLELNATKERMGDFDFKIKISNSITLVVYPKQKTQSNYKFLRGQNWREVNISKVDIIRFFRDRGVNVTKMETEDREELEESRIVIYVDDGSHNLEFTSLFNSQIADANETETIDRELEANSHGNRITIYPHDEKTYPILV